LFMLDVNGYLGISHSGMRGPNSYWVLIKGVTSFRGSYDFVCFIRHKKLLQIRLLSSTMWVFQSCFSGAYDKDA